MPFFLTPPHQTTVPAGRFGAPLGDSTLQQEAALRRHCGKRQCAGRFQSRVVHPACKWNRLAKLASQAATIGLPIGLTGPGWEVTVALAEVTELLTQSCDCQISTFCVSLRKPVLLWEARQQNATKCGRKSNKMSQVPWGQIYVVVCFIIPVWQNCTVSMNTLVSISIHMQAFQSWYYYYVYWGKESGKTALSEQMAPC